MNHKTVSYLKFITAAVLFGFNGYIAGKISLSSAGIVLVRMLVGAVLLFLIMLITGKMPRQLDRRELRIIVGAGVLMGINMTAIFEAYKQIGISLSTLVVSCAPVLILVCTPLLFHEKLQPRKLLGFAVVLTGAILSNPAGDGGSAGGFGLLCALIAALTYAFMIILSKLVTKTDGLTKTALQLGVCFLTVLVYLIVSGGFPLRLQSGDIGWIAWFGIVNTGIGCYLYHSTIKELPAQSIVVCGYIEPVVAILSSVVLCGERLSALQWVGAILILCGALFSELMPAGQKP